MIVGIFSYPGEEETMNAIADVRYLTQTQYDQIDPRFDAEFGVYWAQLNLRPQPSFNPQLLIEVRQFIDGIINSGGRINQHDINYVVLSSKVPGIFSLGGDLALFRNAILHKDREQLAQYGRLCIDDLLPWSRNFDLPITTISLVQGAALGGGFEGALASSVLIAEESARMGFPEILFNLFPGMGAYSFLSRKVGRRVTDELITSGNTYTARQLFDMGVVDVITADGTGEAAVYSYVRKHAKNANGRRGFERVRRDFDPITREELSRIVDIWIDTAMKLSDRDLKMMERLVRAQLRNATENIPTITEPVSEVLPLLEAVGAD
jgi:DSF synthase